MHRCKLEMPIPDVTTIPSPLGVLQLRPERVDDREFRYCLFCDSRQPEWYQVQLDPRVREQLMQHQFHAQTVSYAAQFPRAQFDIVELEGERIGRIVVNRPGDVLHIVDQAIVPRLRSRGIGSAIMLALMREAANVQVPVRLKVASDNDPSLRLYLRLGFIQIEEASAYLELQWLPGPPSATA